MTDQESNCRILFRRRFLRKRLRYENKRLDAVKDEMHYIRGQKPAGAGAHQRQRHAEKRNYKDYTKVVVILENVDSRE